MQAFEANVQGAKRSTSSWTFSWGWEWTFSNRLEQLAEGLAAQWRAQPHPWLKRRVVVPNQSIGYWLQHTLADTLGVCTGMEWMTPRGLAAKLHREHLSQTQKALPEAQELQLYIYRALKKALNTADERQAYTPCALALRASPIFSLGLDEERLFTLSEMLAKVFARYSTFDQRAVERGLEGRSEAGESWQRELWRAIFGPTSPWCTLSELCNNLQKRDPPRCKERDPERLDLFALRMCSSSEWRLVQQASRGMRVHLFALSPCRYYWADVRSSREKRRWLRWIAAKGASASTLEAFEEVLRGAHPLLASLGKVGRRFVELSEIGTPPIHERYALSEKLADLACYRPYWQQDLIPLLGATSLLERLHADLLLMRDLANVDEEHEKAPCDGTLQVHGAPTRKAEVQIALSLIHQSLQRDHTLAPSDILVLASDLEAYEPLVTNAFAEGGAKLECQVLERASSSYGGYWQSLDQLLHLVQGGWSAADQCSALENPLIAQSVELSAKEVNALTALIREGKVSWGLNMEHREAYLGALGEKFTSTKDAKPFCTQTWNTFHQSILRGLAVRDGEESAWRARLDPSLSLPQLVEDLATMHIVLDKWLRWFSSMCAHFGPIVRNEMHPLTHWVQIFSNAASSLFPHTNDQDVEKRAFSRWCRSWHQRALEIPAFAKSANHTPMPALIALKLLRDQMSTLEAARPFREQAVRVASFGSGATPARIICLLGAGEGILPCHAPSQPFELGTADGVEYFPTAGDRDRALFLEMVLAARQRLFITYCSLEQASEEPSTAPEPSLLVTELLHTLAKMVGDSSAVQPKSIFDAMQRSEGPLHVVHPPHADDERYFMEASPFRHFGERAFSCAAARSNENRPSPTNMVNWGADSPQVPRTPMDVVTLKQLGAALSRPLEFYLKEQCHISLWQMGADERTWLLPKGEQRRMQKRVFLDQLQVSAHASHRHLLVRANWAKVFEFVECQMRQTEELGEAQGRGFDLFFARGITSARKFDDGSWLLPAITTQIACRDAPIVIEGSFSEMEWLSSRGLSLPHLEAIPSNFGKFCRSWPAILAYCDARAQIGLPNKIHFGGVTWVPEDLDTKARWSALLDFVQGALHHPLPLLPEGLENYEAGDAESLQHCFLASLEQERRSIGQGVLHGTVGAHPETELFAHWINCYRRTWRSFTEPLLRPLIDQWQAIIAIKKARKPPATH